MSEERGLVKAEPQGLQPLTRAAIKAYINPNVTDAEAELFLRYCIAHNLDPYRREVHLVKYAGSSDPAQMVVGIDCFMRRASQNPAYKGYKAGVIVEKGGKLEYREGELRLKGEELIGGYCDVFREGRTLPRAQVGMNEYRRYKKDGTPTKNWADDGMPATMIVKCATAHGHRRAFPEDVGEMYIAEEMPVIEETRPRAARIVIAPPGPPTVGKLKPEEVGADKISEAEIISVGGEAVEDAPVLDPPPAFASPEILPPGTPEAKFEAAMEEIQGVAEGQAEPLTNQGPPPVKVETLEEKRKKIAKMIFAMAGDDKTKAEDMLERFTTFPDKVTKEPVGGKRDPRDLTDKQIPPTYKKVCEAYEIWKYDQQALAGQGLLQ